MTASPFKAFVSLERLYHFRCGACDAWWNVADRSPLIGQTVHCPDCGVANLVKHIENQERSHDYPV